MRGHIRKRSKGSWTIVLSLGRDPQTGKKKYQWQSVKGTKKQAEKVLADLLHRLDTGMFIKPTKHTVAELLRQWQRDYVATSVRPVTAEGYAQKVNSYIIPNLGSIALSNLQPSHLQAFYRKLLENGRMDGTGGLSPRSVLHVHRILNEALTHAVKWGLVARNVAQAVDPPRAPRKEMETLDVEGVERLLNKSEGTLYHPLIHLTVYTGLRRSELLGLRWRDIDLDMATLSIVQVLHRLRDGRIVFQEPKSQKSRRQVALSPTAVLALRDHKVRQESERMLMGIPLTPDNLVFSHLDGSPFLPDTVSHAFLKIARRAGLNGIRFHDLRHTHATLMLQQGIHPKIVSERLGHSTVSLTLDIYSHVTPGLQQAAALRFEEGLENGRGLGPNQDLPKLLKTPSQPKDLQKISKAPE